MGRYAPRAALNQVLFSNHQNRYRLRPQILKLAAQTVLASLRYRKTLVSIAFVSDAQIKSLNQRFLSRSRPTDVLAFPFGESWPQAPARGGEKTICSSAYLGDVIISVERACVQAKRFHSSFGEELIRYVCHGILHLAGRKDKTELEREHMTREENRLLRLVTQKRKKKVIHGDRSG